MEEKISREIIEEKLQRTLLLGSEEEIKELIKKLEKEAPEVLARYEASIVESLLK